MARDRRNILSVDIEDEAPQLSVVGGVEHSAPEAKTEWIVGAAAQVRKEPHAPVKDLQNLASRFSQSLRGESVVELDPALIDPSFVSDRLEITDAEISDLAEQIRERGQIVPILVRLNPTDDTRYQIAYGHRRWRAAKALGIKVKAVVKDLTDEDLIVAQGEENNARSDLTFIERARFATILEDRGFGRPVISEAVAIHQTDLSTMIHLFRRLPPAVVEAIGKAPNIGRPRWTQLQKALADQQAIDRVEALAKTQPFLQLQSEARFAAALQEASNRGQGPAKSSEDWVDPRGRKLVVIDRAVKKSSVHFDTAADAGFAEYVVSQLNDLYTAYRSKAV